MPVFKTITDINAPEMDLYARLSEAEAFHYNEPEIGFFVAESPNVISRALEAGYEPVSFLMEERHVEGAVKDLLLRIAEEEKAAWDGDANYGDSAADPKESSEPVPVYTASLELLNQLTGFGMTRGVLSVMKRRPLPSLEEICEGKKRLAVMEDVMNPTNVGAIFRSAAALGMEAVILTSGSSDPLYRRAARVSMGTVFQIPWTKLPPAKKAPEGSLNDRLHELGFRTVAMALSGDPIDLSLETPEKEALLKEEKLAIILGTEGDGLAADTIRECDYTARIPMSAGVDSLNVAAASAVAFWELRRR